MPFFCLNGSFWLGNAGFMIALVVVCTAVVCQYQAVFQRLDALRVDELDRLTAHRKTRVLYVWNGQLV